MLRIAIYDIAIPVFFFVVLREFLGDKNSAFVVALGLTISNFFKILIHLFPLAFSTVMLKWKKSFAIGGRIVLQILVTVLFWVFYLYI